jgi:hypothetical protein
MAWDYPADLGRGESGPQAREAYDGRASAISPSLLWHLRSGPAAACESSRRR